MASYAKNRVEQGKRLKQIEQFLLVGMTHAEMARKLDVSEKTVRRDLKTRQSQLADQLQFETATYRGAILSELGRIMADCVKDARTHREQDQHTDRYLSVRVEALRLVSRLTGAEMPSKTWHLHASQNLPQFQKRDGATLTNGPVQIIIEQNGGQFDNEFGRVRVDSPSTDEISSAGG